MPNPPYLQRLLPPSQAIERKNKIGVNSDKLQQLLKIILDPNHPQFAAKIPIFLATMEKIRDAVQSNLGLSAIQRDTYEINQAIWIKKGKPNFILDKNGKLKTDSIIYDAAITALRTVNLPVSPAVLNFANSQITIIRKATCTGAFNINVGSGPLKAMATPGSFATVLFDGTNWILAAYGTL